DRLRNLLVMVALENAVPLEEGEFYLYELIGLNVQTESGEALGTLTEVLETGANDVYVVNSPRYGEVLIPVLPETILETNIAAKRMTVRLPDGLLPEQGASSK
ncbi:MAG: 16S rRNA processing protein RimM, partial [Anaerolinea sp.]|nr:16S rRNA processing protein RimM [Anaerolinea sp.]